MQVPRIVLREKLLLRIGENNRRNMKMMAKNVTGHGHVLHPNYPSFFLRKSQNRLTFFILLDGDVGVGPRVRQTNRVDDRVRFASNTSSSLENRHFPGQVVTKTWP